MWLNIYFRLEKYTYREGSKINQHHGCDKLFQKLDNAKQKIISSDKAAEFLGDGWCKLICTCIPVAHVMYPQHVYKSTKYYEKDGTEKMEKHTHFNNMIMHLAQQFSASGLPFLPYRISKQP